MYLHDGLEHSWPRGHLGSGPQRAPGDDCGHDGGRSHDHGGLAAPWLQAAIQHQCCCYSTAHTCVAAHQTPHHGHQPKLFQHLLLREGVAKRGTSRRLCSIIVRTSNGTHILP